MLLSRLGIFFPLRYKFRYVCNSVFWDRFPSCHFATCNFAILVIFPKVTFEKKIICQIENYKKKISTNYFQSMPIMIMPWNWHCSKYLDSKKKNHKVKKLPPLGPSSSHLVFSLQSSRGMKLNFTWVWHIKLTQTEASWYLASYFVLHIV